MKDKIFMTFLCVAVFGVTNAMGDTSGDVGICMVQTVQEATISGDAVEYDVGDGRSVRIYSGTDAYFMFIADDEALVCGDENCGEGVEIKMSGKDYVFKCMLDGEFFVWNQYAIPFCEDSKVKQLDVENATYSIVHKGQVGEIFDRGDYAIDTKGFCRKSDCKAGYNVEVNNEGGRSTYRCEAQTGGEGNKATENGGDGTEIEQLGKLLDEETEKFERSKWRDAEGKFNTARLASDSIAAVVLGTAGGLISSKVIKKKQVENGFEDIKCTIGSQEVADWGDEFQVGIQ